MATRIDGDLIVAGSFKANSFAVPSNSVGDTQFKASDALTAAKQEHQYARTYAQANGSAVVSETRGIHIAYAGGTLQSLVAALKTACVGAATVVVDLKKNGTTVLSGTITLDNSIAAYATVAATFSSTAYSADDVFEVVVTSAAGGGTLGQGLTVTLVTHEDAA